MVDIDTMAARLAKQGFRLHLTTTIHDAATGTNSYLAVASKPGKPGEGPRGFGRTPMSAFEDMCLNDMHKDSIDELVRAYSGSVSALRRLRDALG